MATRYGIHRVVQLLAVVALVLSGTACKLRLTVPEGGRIVSESGSHSCEAGQTCEIDVVDGFFNETFQAQPAPGYRFIRWHRREFALCGGLNTRCPLTTSYFPGTPLMQILESDTAFYLEPEFALRGTWSASAGIPTPRIGFGVCTAGGKIYAIGGYEKAGSPGLQIVEEYDPTTDRWTVRAPMPTGRRFLSVSSAFGRCYAIGGDPGAGQPPLSVVEEYNPATDRWRRRADLPEPRSAHASATVAGKIYVVGGADVAENPAFGPAIPTTFVYDPKGDLWNSRAQMTVARIFLAVTAVADKLYALGGVPRGFTTAEATLQQYDPDTDSWVLLPDMPFTRANHMAASVNGRIYVIGGRDGLIGSTSAPPSAVYEFHPHSGTWATRAGLPDPRVFLAGGAIGKTIFAVSGALGVVNPHPGVASVTEFQP